jgi:hypothetical protein
MNLPTYSSKQTALLELAKEIDGHPNWWRFPTQGTVQGFLGTGSVFIVGDQPSTSPWEESHPHRKAFYGNLQKIGIPNAHLTDLYKQRGFSGQLRGGLPRDFQHHLKILRKEIEIIQPSRIVALGWLAFNLMRQHTSELRPILRRMWHFSYAVRSGRLPEYERHMRIACGLASS